MEKKKWKFVICVVGVCLIWGVFFYGIKRMPTEPDDFSWVYQVDNVYASSDGFFLEGFAFEQKKDSSEQKFEIVLEEINSEKRYFGKMEYAIREDVNEYFLCQYNYSKSGFKVRFDEKNLDLQNKDYEILLFADGGVKRYRTGIYISKGSLMFSNPQKFNLLDVDGTDLEQVIENGVLRVYSPENYTYVYQYDGELYWIMEKDAFAERNIMVPYYTFTTQNERIPHDIEDTNKEYESHRFSFLTKELNDWNTGEYRVAKSAIPTDYSVTKIRTGKLEENWIWKVDFRPWYELDSKSMN